MEVYQLRYFIAVAETANFTKAAERSFISQPSLSQQILNLEEEVDQKLFHRLGRKVALTDAGQILLEHAYRIVTEVENATRELKEDPEQGYRVSVGIIPTVAHFFLPAVVAHCRTNEVRLTLTSYESFRAEIVTAILDGEIDLGLVSLPVDEKRLVATPLFTESLLLGLSSEHPLAAAKEVHVADLRGQNFIMLGDASSLTSQVQRLLGDLDFEPRIMHRAAQISTVKSLTALGLGVSILPRSARTANDPAGLVYRKFSGVAPTRTISLIRHYRRHLGRGAQMFADAARAVIGPLHAGANESLSNPIVTSVTAPKPTRPRRA